MIRRRSALLAALLLASCVGGGDRGPPVPLRPRNSPGITLNLPTIPKDLVGRVTLSAQIAAVDPAGDRVEGQVSLLLSQDGLEVSDPKIAGHTDRAIFKFRKPR